MEPKQKYTYKKRVRTTKLHPKKPVKTTKDSHIKFHPKKPVKTTKDFDIKFHLKKPVKTNKDSHICPAGHICKVTRDKFNTRFLCKICDERGNFKDGAYVCKKCKYAVHENCPKTDFKCEICHKRNCQEDRSVCA